MTSMVSTPVSAMSATAAASEDSGGSTSAAPTTAANDSRRTILDTAARLFRKEGYAAVSLRDISAACGMKAGSLYYHFASKDEIVSEVLRIGVERVFAEVRASIDALGQDAAPEQVFRTAVRAHLRALLESHDYTSANIRIFGHVPAPIRAAQLPLRDEYEAVWADIIARLAPRRKKRSDELRFVRFFLLGAMNGTLDWFHAGHASVDEVAQRYASLALSGLLGASPG
ncbi:TetR/AcrR family transcriptional regulator [Paraburkholderia fungorum]|uniref:TetR/AcrR family transcriptional regulator n=1 Tax=Paraburkholderia fungorum TaxID=134537 RepID=UPI0038B9410C